MTQKSYLRELRCRLFLRLGEDERKEVLRDYQEYFEDGIARGESENTVAARLGSPSDAVSALLHERTKRDGSRLQAFLVWGQVGCVAILLLFLIHPISVTIAVPWNPSQYFLLRPWMVGLFFGWLAFLAGMTASVPQLQKGLEKRTIGILVLSTVFCLAAAAVLGLSFFLFFHLLKGEWEGVIWLGPACNILLLAAGIAAALAWIDWVVHKQALFLFGWMSGLIMTMASMRMILHQLSDPDALWPSFWVGFLPLLAGAASSILAWAIQKRRAVC